MRSWSHFDKLHMDDIVYKNRSWSMNGSMDINHGVVRLLHLSCCILAFIMRLSFKRLRGRSEISLDIMKQ